MQIPEVYGQLRITRKFVSAENEVLENPSL